jgi:hypothetical protein
MPVVKSGMITLDLTLVYIDHVLLGHERTRAEISLHWRKRCAYPYFPYPLGHSCLVWLLATRVSGAGEAIYQRHVHPDLAGRSIIHCAPYDKQSIGSQVQYSTKRTQFSVSMPSFARTKSVPSGCSSLR